MQTRLQAKIASDAVQLDRNTAQQQVLADNRPKAVAQGKLVDMMNNSSRVLRQWAPGDAIHSSPRMVAQRRAVNALHGGAKSPNNTGLPDQLKSGIEALSGISMDHVRVHYNSDKPAQLHAHAYAQGSEIHVAPGQQHHLPHEAWHVVQQAQGSVRPTVQMKSGARINSDAGLENEADVMGARALSSGQDRTHSSPHLQLYSVDSSVPRIGNVYPVQRVIKDKASGDPVDGYDLDDLDFHSAVYLNGQISDGNLTADEDDLEKIAAALEKGEPDYSFAKKESKSKGYKKEVVEEKAFVPTTKAESSKQGDIQPYLNLIDHLSGEEKKGVLSGGHLLSDMKKKYPNLLISGETNDDSPWEGWWSDGKANPKWSSFFPASWTRNSLVEQLWGSSQCKGGRLFKCGIAISKTGDTFYPWVSQTLTAAPKLTDMKKA